MLAEERWSDILKLLTEKGSVTVQQLCTELDTSESTIRRDLLELDKLGKLHRVHGGATLLSGEYITDEATMSAKETLAVDQKRSMAEYAASLITAQDFVFIDAGSSTLLLAQCISGDALKAAYVTSGIAHARILAQKGCRVYIPEGQIRPSTEAIVGAGALASLQKYNFTKSFIGTNGVSLTAGFTTPDVEEAQLKATAVHRSREAWFLADDSKFDKIYAAVICNITEGSIITNHLPETRYKGQTKIKETQP